MNGGFFCKQINKITDIIKKNTTVASSGIYISSNKKIIISFYLLLKIIRRIFKSLMNTF